MVHVYHQPAIFEDIAQEAVSLCRQSLVSSSTTIGQRNAPASTLDGELFLVRHLLILKEVTNNLDLAGREIQQQTSQGGMTGKLSASPNLHALLSTVGMNRCTGFYFQQDNSVTSRCALCIPRHATWI